LGRPSKYPREFRESAVEMVRSTGRPVGQIARELGMSDSTLTNWVRADRAARGETEPEEQLTVSEKAELARLRRENAQLRMEKEILKKAAAFFVQESTK
jgi:transposase